MKTARLLSAPLSPRGRGGEKKGNYIQEDPALVTTAFGRLKDLPRLSPQFVEPVETNPEVTAAFAPHPRPFDHENPLVCNSQRNLQCKDKD